MKIYRPIPFALALLVLVLLTRTTSAAINLIRISRDPYSNTSSQHHTQVEPDSFAYGNTIIAAFQTGRFYDGGASNIGYAASTDGGTTWSDGFLPNTTVYAGGTYSRISDPSVAYDAKHATWLIASLGLSDVGQSAFASRSLDNGATWSNPVLVEGPDNGFDKTWVVCDNTLASPYYGNCYLTWDDANAGGLNYIALSADGGITWSIKTASGSSGLGGQPIAQPNGTVVIPYYGFNGTMLSIRSTDGGATWSTSTAITNVSLHSSAGDIRSDALPSAEVDANGRIYLVWQDCRFIKNCTANDIVMATSMDGLTWTSPKRIPLDSKTSGVDHFIPGIGVDPSTGGDTAHLALTYYYYPQTQCNTTTCKLNVGYATSSDGGATWSARQNLVTGMKLKWLPNTTLGYMVGDYISTSFVNGKVFPIFSRALEKRKKFRQSIYTVSEGLAMHKDILPVIDEPIESVTSERPPRPIAIRP